MRRTFADEIYKHMQTNKDIWLVVGDLGYRVWDKHREDFPDRYINTGAAEQAMMDIAVGLSLEGKIPIVYSITTFLLYRPFEQIRNYVNHEKLNVKLIGSGRDKDYAHDGFSHWSEDDRKLFGSGKIFDNIQAGWPETKEEIPDIVKRMLKINKPYYINLKRI